MGRRTRRGGFTLLEAVVVLAILVAVTSMVVPLLSSSQDDSLVAVARTEMQAIRQACLRWKQDVGTYPANLADLVSNAAPASLAPPLDAWNPNTNRGWRGPYLTSGRVVGTSLADPWYNAASSAFATSVYAWVRTSDTGPCSITSRGPDGREDPANPSAVENSDNLTVSVP